MFDLAVMPHYKIINTISSLRSSRPKVFSKKVPKIPKILKKTQGLFFNKVAAPSCEFCEIFKNIFFHRTPLVAASILCRNSFLFCFTVFSEWIFQTV